MRAVKEGSKKIRDTMFNTIITLFLKHDNASETARYILGKVISKRSINGTKSMLLSLRDLHASFRPEGYGKITAIW